MVNLVPHHEISIVCHNPGPELVLSTRVFKRLSPVGSGHGPFPRVAPWPREWMVNFKCNSVSKSCEIY
eukprot:COSAG02_NODE_1431_length_12649_cov_6.571793_1_plen_68_part_00